MKTLLLIGMAFLLHFAKAQTSPDTGSNIIIPATAQTTDEIAGFVTAHYKTETEKFTAIYKWVISNINYSTDSMYVINWSLPPEARVTEAMRRRKGVCENFAAIFTDIAQKSNLSAYTVNGYTKQNNNIDKSGHAWCVVKIKEEWYCCDPTWDRDASTPTYFLMSPGDFIASHFPFNSMWQLLTHPFSASEFEKGHYTSSANNFYNFNDSIKAFNDLKPLQQLELEYDRMQGYSKQNSVVKNRLAYTKMQIALIYEEKDMNLYNAAVDELNRATKLYNSIAEYRSNSLTPVKKIADINQVLNTASNTITSAKRKITSLSIYNQQYDPSELLERLSDMKNKIAAQKEFFKQYLVVNNKEKQ